MRDDFENQSASTRAQDADPSGERTNGVLTKSDTLQTGEHEKWLKVLKGETSPLRHSYFCTKLPSVADLGRNLSWEDARAEEKNFFDTVIHWKNSGRDMRDRLGTAKLTAFLSRQLGAYISEKNS